MRRIAKRKRKTVAEANVARAQFVRSFARCFCGCGKQPTVCHEIVRGGSRQLGILHREAWLALTWDCHERLHREVWSVARQLWHKRKHDPAYYDRRLVNVLRGRAPDAVTESEVNEAGAIE